LSHDYSDLRAEADIRGFCNTATTAWLAKVVSTVDFMTGFFSEEIVPMLRFRNYLPLVAFLVGAAMVGNPTQAHAALKLRITSAGADNNFATTGDNLSFTWTDQSVGPPPDANPIPGMVGTGPAFAVGSFLVNVDGTSTPFGINDAYNANLHLHALTVTNVGGVAGLIRVELTDTDYSLIPQSNGLAALVSTIGGTANSAPLPGSQVTLAQQLIQLGAGPVTEFAPAPTFTLTNAPPALGPGGFTDTKQGLFAYTGGNFSITEKIELSLTAGAIVSLDYDSHAFTPAPPGFVLAVTAGLALLGYRFRRNKVVA